MELKKIRISEKKQALLHQMQLDTVEDLLAYYPFRYETIKKVAFLEWAKAEQVALEGTICSRAHVVRLQGKRSLTNFKITNEDGEFTITIFNRPWTSQFTIGKRITVLGRYEGNFRITAIQYNFQPLMEQIGMHPIYHVKDGITQKDMHRYLRKAWEVFQNQIQDLIPISYRNKYHLIPKRDALYGIHFPKDEESLKQSLRYLKYEEFLKFQLVMQSRKVQAQKNMSGHAKHFSMDEIERVKKTLPFALTDDQNQAIEDILQDLSGNKVMYRMVQGDVGCGKTLVAAFAMLACVLAHKQAAFLAPTEILAKQHAKNLQQVFADEDITVELLCSSLKAQEKQGVLKRLQNNEIDIVVGTHALFQEQVNFYDLGLVVADEQHRFGVQQRRKMLEKGEKVDFLLMSATPIPRTLALSVYGDMDVSTIQQLPKNRASITTKFIHSNSMQSILDHVLQRLDEGTQCYVVCPAIEANETIRYRNVNDIYDGLQATLGKKYKIALLHGKMSVSEKDSIMEAFKNGEIQILVSTTVIEVGVDVANANIMIIYDAHRFGLSQLHQLRGRVGRGKEQGECYLLSASKEEESLKRLRILEHCLDGFAIAKEDLKLRGPGDILGIRQSGIPGFILGDLIQDANILEVAKQDAEKILQDIDQYPEIRILLDEDRKRKEYLD